ncbi:DUF2339 domain-containing protein [Bradyrhizobium erythrophlei]|uniref:Uncharacterized membrane protein n=1 Tax=Bradyrhizobium erythrophlei TaxID=1437360 RepID=A0A1M7T7K0_9BRAD|nr:DUF2339 domain-containing protein [Bradyrhizobium erythrophlei]SHN66632.1 Uncharacterized membrane protein [Bradyrhizobium erythrophlei]
MFEIFAVAIAVIALIVARKAMDQAATLKSRLDALEASGWRASPIPPPLAPAQEAEPATTPEIPATTIAAEPETPFHETAPSIADDAASAVPTTPPPLPPAAPGFEERVGTRWVVWLGGLTLALGGFFMVRYSIDAGLLGPGVRTLLGGAFASALLAAGEWTRRKESTSSVAALPIANIPAVLTAAGTAVAFGTAYAAYALYDFLAPASAFILLGLVALGTLAAALLHGPMLAGLGIVAAFGTPLLVSSEKPDFWALYIYLAVVTAASFGLARARLWSWLAVTTVVLALIWILPVLKFDPPDVGPYAFHAIAGFTLAALLVVCGFLFGPSNENDNVEWVSSGSLAAYLFGAMLIVLASFHASAAIVVFAILTAATLLVAWRAPSTTAAVAPAAAFVGLVFLVWAVRVNPDMLVWPGGPLPGIGPSPTDESVSLHLTVAALFAVAFGSAGFLAQGRNSNALVPVIWSASGVFTPLALLIALYARIAHLDRSIPFAILAVGLAILFAAATEILSKRDARPGLVSSTALFATGTLAALALALTFALDKGWLTIALALTSAGAAWVSTQRPIPFLRVLSSILAAIVVLRVGYEPRIVGEAVGTTPIFNWLLWGYGIPALSFWTASVFLRRRGDDAPLRSVEAAAILFTVLLVFLEIRHAMNGGNVYRDTAGLTETALQVCAALAMAIGLERLRLRSGSIVHNVSAILLTLFAGAATLFGLFFLDNPAIWHIEINGEFINELLLGYAAPAILALLLSYAVAGRRHAAYGNTLAAGALILALSYISLEIRRFYQGPVLSRGGTPDIEQYTYSIAWLGFGVLLLVIGIWANSQRARLASAVVIALTIGKVFLIDLSTLTGVYRALSFMGLGLVLVAIGWFYQKVLFRREAASATPVTST